MEDERDEKRESEFKVRDRRRFQQKEDGSVVEREGEEIPKEDNASSDNIKKEEQEKKKTGTGEKTVKEEGQNEGNVLPEVNFSTFLLSLSTSALLNMGLIADPLTKQKKRQLPIAKQTIDMIGMLKEKTKGNLTEEEGKLIEGLLFDLKMKYVEESKKSK